MIETASNATFQLFVIGLLLFGSGYLLQIYLKSKEPMKGRTKGRIINLIPDEPDAYGKSRGIHNYYYPVVEFFANGILYKMRCRKGGYPSPYQMNQEVMIYYVKENPKIFRIVDHETRSRLPYILYGLGTVFLVFGCFFYLIFASRG